MTQGLDVHKTETINFILVVAVVALTTYISGIVLWAGGSPDRKKAGMAMLILCIAAVVGGFGVFNAYGYGSGM